MDINVDLDNVFSIIREIDISGGQLICPNHLKEAITISEGSSSDNFRFKIEVVDKRSLNRILEIKIFR